MFKCGLH